MIYPRTKSHHLSNTTQNSIQSVQNSGIPTSGLRILSSAPRTISITANMRSIETASPAIGSVLPCPYGWFTSAGFWAYLTPRSTIMEPIISVALSIASAMRAYEFPNIHPRNLIVASDIFAMIPRMAIFSPSFGVDGVFMRLWYGKEGESKSYNFSQPEVSSPKKSVSILFTVKWYLITDILII